jgi:retron-type reverse transcriptase
MKVNPKKLKVSGLPSPRLRPLAVAALEDKIVQRATVAVLNAIYEEDFLGFSYGFRAGSLLLHRIGLAPTARCRSPGALRKSLDTTRRIA